MKKKFKYDGKSRPTNDTYTKRWNEILGLKKKKKNYKKVLNNQNVIEKNIKMMSDRDIKDYHKLVDKLTTKAQGQRYEENLINTTTSPVNRSQTPDTGKQCL